MMSELCPAVDRAGLPVEAIRLYREQIAAAEAMAADPAVAPVHQQWKAIKQQAQQGIQQALRASKPEPAPSTPGCSGPVPDSPRSGESVDLYLSVAQVRDSSRRPSRAGWSRSAPQARRRRREAPTRSPRASPRSWAGPPTTSPPTSPPPSWPSPRGSRPRSTRRPRGWPSLVERTPLETLPAGRAPEAARPTPGSGPTPAKRLGLWLVARECWTRAGMKARGDLFAARALEAARRQADPDGPRPCSASGARSSSTWATASQAERRWSELLDLVLARPEPKASAEGGQPEAVPATPRENFDQAIALARMAADRGLTPLSIRAVREAFRGGSPVGASARHRRLEPGDRRRIAASIAMIVRTKRADEDDGASGQLADDDNDGPSADAATAPIASRIAELDRPLGRPTACAPRERLRDPPRRRPAARPPLRRRPLPARPGPRHRQASQEPRRPARRPWPSARRGRRAAGRPSGPERGARSPSSPAWCSRPRSNLASGRPEAAAPTLDQIEIRLASDTLKVSAELAAHAALPALEPSPSREKSAEAVLDRAIKNLSTQAGRRAAGHPDARPRPATTSTSGGSKPRRKPAPRLPRPPGEGRTPRTRTTR